MQQNSIEILGQKLSYPTTWQGVASVMVVFASLCFIAKTLNPQQIQAYESMFSLSDKESETHLTEVTKKLNEEVITLRQQVIHLTKHSSLDNASKQAILLKVEQGKQGIDSQLSTLIDSQIKRKNDITEKIDLANAQQKFYMKAEITRIDNLLAQYQQQKRLQQ